MIDFDSPGIFLNYTQYLKELIIVYIFYVRGRNYFAKVLFTFSKHKPNRITLRNLMQGNVERFVFQFVKSLRKISFYSKFFKKIETSEASNNGILICREFPIISVKFYKSDAFILGYHVYKTVRTLSYNRKIFSLFTMWRGCSLAHKKNEKCPLGLPFSISLRTLNLIFKDLSKCRCLSLCLMSNVDFLTQ